jgi:Alpha-glutamyl/putrescinyl thymine pyrophosphorylase clade 3
MRTTTVHDAVGAASTWIIDHPVQIGSHGACGSAPALTGTKRPTAGCGMPNDDEPWDPDASRELSALNDRLTAVLHEPDLAALPEVDVARFAQWVLVMQRGQREWERQLDTPHTLGRMDIFRWIAESKAAGDDDEALWRGFLAAHFGRGSANPSKPLEVESAAQLLCGFSQSPNPSAIWTWDAVSSVPEVFRDWLYDHRDQLGMRLRFGNHRKRRSKQPGDLFKVVKSFVEWVDQHGGTPQEAFSTAEGRTPEEAFDILNHRIMNPPPPAQKIYDFGRLAALDMLILLGESQLLPIRPGSVYLEGATGPLEGVRKLWGNKPVKDLAWKADELARRVPLAFDIVEDALCMWQK